MDEAEIRGKSRDDVKTRLRGAVREAQTAGGTVQALLEGSFGGPTPSTEHEQLSLEHAAALIEEGWRSLERARLLVMGAGPRDFDVTDNAV